MEKLTLPVELVREILLRLPVKSVLRFKCVCKTWHSLISEPHFGISHYHLTAAPSYRLLLEFNESYFESVDTEPHLGQDSSAGNLLLFPSHPFGYESVATKMILGSCRGLVSCCYHRGWDHIDLILWNPSTGVYKRLPIFEYLYGFGYDASTDDYLLVLIPRLFAHQEPKVHVFSFKTYSWNLYDNNVLYSDFFCLRRGLLLNGALHWLVICEDEMRFVIIAFDLTQRTLSEIPLSLNHFSRRSRFLFSFSKMGECLSVCCTYPDPAITDIWVMKEYKVRSSWTKLLVIPLIYNSLYFYPICITKDGGVVGGFGLCKLERLVKFNDKGELVDNVAYNGNQRWDCGNLQYRESLLSPINVIGDQH
ncbi:hypothetical protein Fmac_017356 [Flemingia macrophylla]|uniref:F-box domain-containing protein n=1 Tax=Flemingia macrophylla TaxID=520843 RepID=A0ABD1M1W1_9FABA